MKFMKASWLVGSMPAAIICWNTRKLLRELGLNQDLDIDLLSSGLGMPAIPGIPGIPGGPPGALPPPPNIAFICACIAASSSLCFVMLSAMVFWRTQYCAHVYSSKP